MTEWFNILSFSSLTLLQQEPVPPAFRNQWDYLQGKAQFSGETLIMFHNLVAALQVPACSASHKWD